MKNIRRYSESFKQEVLNKILRDGKSILEVRRMYDIRGNGTVERWLRSSGHSHLLNELQHIYTVKDMDKLKQLEAEKKALEAELGRMQMRLAFSEALIEVADEEYGLDIKKTLEPRLKESDNKA